MVEIESKTFSNKKMVIDTLKVFIIAILVAIPISLLCYFPIFFGKLRMWGIAGFILGVILLLCIAPYGLPFKMAVSKSWMKLIFLIGKPKLIDYSTVKKINLKVKKLHPYWNKLFNIEAGIVFEIYPQSGAPIVFPVSLDVGNEIKTFIPIELLSIEE